MSIGKALDPSPLRWQWLFNILLYLSFVLTVVQVTSVLFGDYRNIFNSDGALKTILAEQGAAEGRLLPRLWVYANGDLMLVGPLLASAILRPFLGISYFANAAAGWLCYLYVLAAVYAVCRYFAPGTRRAAAAAATLAAGGLGVANFEFVIGQSAYPVYTALALCLFSLISGSSSKPEEPRNWSGVALAFAGSAIIASGNPLRGAVMIFVPAVAGWIVGCLMLPMPLRDRIRLLANPTVLAAIAGGLAASVLYYVWLLPSVSNFNAVARVQLASPGRIVENITSLIPAWFQYFRVGSGPWATLDFGTRILQASIWALVTSLILAPVYVVVWLRRQSPRFFIFSWVVLAAYGVSFSALCLSDVLFTGPVEMRYATFPIYGSVCIVAILASRIRVPFLANVALLAMCALGVFSAPVGDKLHPAPHIPPWVSHAERERLIDTLSDHNVGIVLASYWNSYVLTVLSNGDVSSYAIGIGDRIMPWAHHTTQLVLGGKAGDRQALVLSNRDAPGVDVWSMVKYQFGEPAQVLSSGPFTIWIYDQNIADIFGSGSAVSAPISPLGLNVDLSLGQIDACMQPVDDCKAEIVIHNVGKRPVATAGTMPLRLGVQGLDAGGQVVAWDLGRVDFPRPLASGESTKAMVDLPEIAPPGVVKYHLCLLQENVAWMCDQTGFDPTLQVR